MSDKAEKKPEAVKEDDAHAQKKKGGGIGALLTKLPVLLGGVMIIEAAVLFAGFKFLGSGNPNAAAGADLTTAEHGSAAQAEGGHGEAAAGEHGGGDGAPVKIDPKKQVELQVVEFRAPNKQSGRTFIYDVSIYMMTHGEHADGAKATIKDRDAQIKDRIRTIIAQSDPDKLGGGSEPGLETLRRQVKYQLDEMLGDGVVDEVLIPRCIPFRADF